MAMAWHRIERLGVSRLALLAVMWLPAPAALAQSVPAASGPATAAPAKASGVTPASKTSPYRVAAKLTPKAQTYYATAWGVDKLSVRYTSSGNLIRFSYRVTDAQRATALSAKASPPYLVGQKNSVVLQVPVMEKIGQLRQTAAPVVGQEYWMAFSNKGNHVKPGDRVNVMIGSFHVEGLMVEGS
jgi:hypothetical protein